MSTMKEQDKNSSVNANYPMLFNPIRIKGMELRNRVVFPAMGTKMADEEGFVTKKLINYHAARALGGNGLNIVEVACVHGLSAPPKFVSIAEDKYLPGLKEMCDAVHQAGGKIGLQLWQGGVATSGYPGVAVLIPSDIPVPGTDRVMKGATKEVIEEAVRCFGEAAKRAVEAGFDCLEFHAAHNYSPHMFLSPAFNHRTDEYGGSFENRVRYLLDCIRSIRANIPADMPLFMRIDAQDDYVENGLTVDDIIRVCLLAKEAGVDVLDVSRGNMTTAAIKYEVPPIDLPKGFNVENAARIRRETGMITIAVGRINDPDQAEEILASEKVDLVVMGRAQLADPDFCNKAAAGQADDIIKCVACNQGCFDGFVSPDMPHITCLRNPALGLEEEYALTQAAEEKTVLVAGGGIAGLEAAYILKKRGHRPVLCEAGDTLGGQFKTAGEAPRKEEMKEAALSFADQVKKAGTEIRLNTPVSEELLDELQPAEVIIATGAQPLKLKVPGADLPHVTNSHDILEGRSTARGRIAVIGGGLVGLEVAEYLAEKSEGTITVVEMLEEAGKDLGQLRKICVLESLYGHGIDVRTNAKCVEIRENSVLLEQDGKQVELEADAVVIAIGAVSRDMEVFLEVCKNRNIPVHVIGDARKARRALNAVAEAFDAARAI